MPRMLEVIRIFEAVQCKSGRNSHKSNNCSNFDDGEHEFGLAITSYAEEVDADNGN
jgi:hypothetical protein